MADEQAGDAGEKNVTIDGRHIAGMILAIVGVRWLAKRLRRRHGDDGATAEG